MTGRARWGTVGEGEYALVGDVPSAFGAWKGAALPQKKDKKGGGENGENQQWMSRVSQKGGGGMSFGADTGIKFDRKCPWKNRKGRWRGGVSDTAQDGMRGRGLTPPPPTTPCETLGIQFIPAYESWQKRKLAGGGIMGASLLSGGESLFWIQPVPKWLSRQDTGGYKKRYF